MRVWRLILDGPGGPAWNMAADEAILEAVLAGVSPPTLRLYRWDRVCITVGRFQNVPRGVNLARCSELGVQVVRRPTGGRGVLHGSDETTSVCAPAAALGEGHAGIVASYRALSEAYARALSRLGVRLVAAPGERAAGRCGDCFAVHSQADLTDGTGAKLVGSAQRRREGVLLQQSSLRHQRPEIDPAELFFGEVGPGEYPLRDVPAEAVRSALIAGFGEALRICLEPGEMSDFERESALRAASDGRAVIVDTQRDVCYTALSP